MQNNACKVQIIALKCQRFAENFQNELTNPLHNVIILLWNGCVLIKGEPLCY
nr:MAG TPA: hypothetical protein [Bacteriophage sp.]